MKTQGPYSYQQTHTHTHTHTHTNRYLTAAFAPQGHQAHYPGDSSLQPGGLHQDWEIDQDDG